MPKLRGFIKSASMDIDGAMGLHIGTSTSDKTMPRGPVRLTLEMVVMEATSEDLWSLNSLNQEMEITIAPPEDDPFKQKISEGLKKLYAVEVRKFIHDLEQQLKFLKKKYTPEVQ